MTTAFRTESAFRIAGLALLSLIAVLAIFVPYLSSSANAISDGQLAQFFESHLGWSDRYIGGWPVYADPNSMFFYPLRHLFPSTREGFDYFSISAAWIFAFGNGVLAWNLTHARRAALLAVVAAPGMGFFIAHMGHTSMLHAASYAPWMILAGLKLSESDRPWQGWVAMLAVSTTLSLNSGHPQITVYSLLGAAMCCVPASRDVTTWLRVYMRAGLGVLLGLGLSSVFLLPATAFVGDSLRASITAQTLQEFALRPFEAGINLFPYAAGGDWNGPNRVPYAGATSTSDWHENIAYVGVCIPFLILVGLRGLWSRSPDRKLLLACMATFLLAIAPSIALASSALVHLPILSLFRAWARWQVVSSTFALQLACIAYAKLGTEGQSRRRALLYCLAPWLMIPAVPLLFRLCHECTSGVGIGTLFSGKNLVQLMYLAGMTVAVYLIATTRARHWGLVLIAPVMFVGAELVFLARQATWANAYAPATALEETRVLAETKGYLKQVDGRLLTMSGWQSPVLSPDHTRAAGIPSLNWYGPLLGSRFAELSGMTVGGWTRPDILSDANQVLDIYGVGVVEPYIPATTPPGLGDELYASPRWQRLPSDNPPGLLLNNRSLPRVRLVAQAVTATDEQALAALRTSRLPDGRLFHAREAVLVEPSDLALPLEGTRGMPAHVTKINSPDEVAVVFQGKSSIPTMLVLGDNFSQNWRAEIDGQPARSLRVNYNQVGVPVPVGAREVRLYYRDARLMLGAWLTLLSTVVLAAVVILGIRTRTKVRE